MPSHLFLLGNTPELSLYEIDTIAKRLKLTLTQKRLAPHLLLVNGQLKDGKRLITLLGGTVKIFQVTTEKDEIAATLALETLLKNNNQRIIFSLHTLGDFDAQEVTLALKRRLEETGKKVRFIKPRSLFDSALSQNPRLTECLLAKVNGQIIVGHAVAVQDINAWAKRDFGRPAPDPKSGMLPPKIARLLVNCALPESISAQTVIYDPFCGSGTILAEALLLGASAIGSDSSQQAVQHANQNLAWLSQTHSGIGTWKLFSFDVAHVKTSDLPQITAIVTEGYLGPANLDNKNIGNLVRGLVKLYLGAFKTWAKILTPGQKIVIALPRFPTERGVKNLQALIDRCENIGYTQLRSPIIYARPHAKVEREIYFFEKK